MWVPGQHLHQLAAVRGDDIGALIRFGLERQLVELHEDTGRLGPIHSVDEPGASLAPNAYQKQDPVMQRP